MSYGTHLFRLAGQRQLGNSFTQVTKYSRKVVKVEKDHYKLKNYCGWSKPKHSIYPVIILRHSNDLKYTNQFSISTW